MNDFYTSPAVQFFFRDFLVSTTSMTSEEVGIYIRLLGHEWNAGPLIDNPERLARLGCSTVEKTMAVLEMKFEKIDNSEPGKNPVKQCLSNAKAPLSFWVNQRLENERYQQHQNYKKRAEAGRIGGRKSKRNQRLTKSKQCLSNAQAMLKPASASAVLKKINNKKEKLNPESEQKKTDSVLAEYGLEPGPDDRKPRKEKKSW